MRIKHNVNNYENSYIKNIPENITIDGAFSDWKGKNIQNDTRNDVEDHNLDIIKYGVSTMDTGTAFYLNVNGEICGGVTVPHQNKKTESEPIPFPEPTTPVTGEYIPKTGEDIVYIFIDTDSNFGFRGNLPISANYMIEIKGRHNKVIASNFYQFAGLTKNDWTWIFRESPKVELETAKLEVGIPWTKIGINPENDNFDVLFLATDWLKSKEDYSQEIITGPTKGFIGDGSTRGFDFKYHAGYDVYFKQDSGQVMFETKDNYYLSWQLPGNLRWEDGNQNVETITQLVSSDLVIDSNRALWPNIYPDVDVSVEYLFESNMLKENIILRNRLSPAQQFTGSLYLELDLKIEFTDGLTIHYTGEKTENGFRTKGDIDFVSSNKVVYSISAPYAEDATGNTVECEYVFNKDTNSLTLRTSYNWLETASYPVKIDPSLNYYTLETDDHIGNYDLFGSSVAVGDFNGDGYADVLSGAENNDNDNDPNGGRAYIYFGPISSNDNTADVTLAFSNTTWQNYGKYVGVGDFNNDGYDDAVIGGNYVDVRIKWGSSSLSGTYTSPDVNVSQVTDWSAFGTSIASGNFNGDVYDDLLIGAPEHLSENGKVYIYYYDSSDWSDGWIHDSPDDTLQSGSNSGIFYLFGTSMTVGNFYSGGLDDVTVGEPYYDLTGSGEVIGRVNLFDGDSIDNNGANVDGPNNIIDGPQGSPSGDYDIFGQVVASGDFNSDATSNDFDDLVVGEPNNDESASNAGRAYIFTCDDNPLGWQTDNPTPVDIPNPEGAAGMDDRFGYSVGAGDVNLDGFDDFFIGAPYSDNNGSQRGAIYIFDSDGSSIPIAYLHCINGSDDGERLGWSVAGGKFSNDTDYLVVSGAPYWDDNSPSHPGAGRVWVIPIPEFGAREIPIIVTTVLVFGLIYKKKKKSKET
jgi:hypothetical protein